MSRNNNILNLPLLTNSLCLVDFNSNKSNKSYNKEIRNVQIGINNFNSKQYEIKKNKVMENKIKKFNPSIFEYQTLNKNLSIFTADSFKPGNSISQIGASYIPERQETVSPFIRVKKETEKKNQDSVLPLIQVSQEKIYIINHSNTKGDIDKQDSKSSPRIDNLQEKIKLDLRIQDSDKINASNDILLNSQSTHNHIPTREKNESSVHKRKDNFQQGKNHVPFQNSCLYNVLGLQTRSLLETKTKIKEENQNYKKGLKKHFIRNNHLTHFLDAKEKNEIPYVFPVASTHDMNFDSLSQLNRFEKMKQSLLNLKYIIEQDEENEIKIIKEFFIKNNLLYERLFTLEYINKFSSYIKSDFNLNPKYTLKELVEKIDKEIDEKPQKKRKVVHKNKGSYTTYNQESIKEKTYFDRFKTQDYLINLDNIERKIKIDKHNTSILIKELENELNKSIYKMSNKKHLNDNKDTFESLNDLDKVKKNNKLLELIVLQRSKTKYYVECTKEK